MDAFQREQIEDTLIRIDQRIETLDHLIERYHGEEHYAFQWTKKLTFQEMIAPSTWVQEMIRSVPSCVFQARCMIVIVDGEKRLPGITNPLKSSFKQYVPSFDRITTVTAGYNRDKDSDVTICFFGISVTAKNFEELEHHPALSTRAKEHVRQKRLLSLFD